MDHGKILFLRVSRGKVQFKLAWSARWDNLDVFFKTTADV